MQRWFPENLGSPSCSREQECPRHTSYLAFEIGHAIPHELDGNGENQEAENLVDGADGAGSKPSHQRSAEPEEQQYGECDTRDANHHAEVGRGAVDMGGKSHDYANRSG